MSRLRNSTDMRYSAGYARVVAAAIDALTSQISVIGPAMQRHALEQDDMDSGHKPKKSHALPGVCVRTEEARGPIPRKCTKDSETEMLEQMNVP